MKSNMMPVEFHFRLNYGRIIVRIVDSSTQEEIAETNVTPAGVELYVALYTYLREKRRLLCGRPTIEHMLMNIGTVMPEEFTPRTMVIRGRNLDTGIPDAIEVSSLNIYEIIEPLLQQLPQQVGWAIQNSLFSDRPSAVQMKSLFGEVGEIFHKRGLNVQSIIVEEGDFPLLNGFDRWLQNVFQWSAGT